MERVVKKFPVIDTEKLRLQLLEWGQTFEKCVWLDSNQYPQRYTSFDKALAVGVVTELTTNSEKAFEKLDTYQQQTNDYLFGYLTYDLKNAIEDLESNNKDELGFHELYFFQPLKLFFIRNNFLEAHYFPSCIDEIERDVQSIFKMSPIRKRHIESVKIKQRISEEAYYRKIKKIQQYIRRGDTYELNYCMEYYAENAVINPLEIYTQLNAISTPPFAVFFKIGFRYILSASPERFLRKEGNKVISQPIKGTIRRSAKKKEEQHLIETLSKDPKERSENIMIVDLVRNDLSKTASKNSVCVEELCKVYTFKQVHQLISTITSILREGVSPVQLLQTMFPAGSMTGAPKISTMQIIEEQEVTKRGVYSGAVGYFTPKGDFDFNVVIRSILYHAEKKYLSFSVGGAITDKANPQAEYQECLLKVDAIKKVLEGSS